MGVTSIAAPGPGGLRLCNAHCYLPAFPVASFSLATNSEKTAENE